MGWKISFSVWNKWIDLKLLENSYWFLLVFILIVEMNGGYVIDYYYYENWDLNIL